VHQLVEAFRILAADGDLPGLRLKAAGYLGPADRPYLQEIQSQLQSWGLAERFEYAGELSRDEKIAFLQSLDVMAAPAVYPESKGLTVLEAWANGVPTVLPNHGTFPEMVAETGGGLLHEPCDAASLAAGLTKILRDREFAAECGRRAQRVVHRHYTAERMAGQTLELYQSLCPPS